MKKFAAKPDDLPPLNECSSCKQVKLKSEFRVHKSRLFTGEQVCWLGSTCKKCKSSRQVERYFSYTGSKYGILEADYISMMKAQNGGCAICGKTECRLVVDHNHKTGRPRGLLCGQCNSALGLFGDDAKTILSAAGYLSRYEE